MWLMTSAVLLAACGATADTGDAGDTDSQSAIYRIRIEQCAGGGVQRATAVAVASDVVATVAHSFEDPGDLMLTDDTGQAIQADVVYLDAATDIALLRISPETTDVLPLAPPETSGPVTFATFADSEGPVVREGEILERVRATLDGEGPRAALRLEADIEPGDSGAPIVDENNDMVGLIFATVRGKDVGWAVSAVEVEKALAVLDEQGPGVAPLACS